LIEKVYRVNQVTAILLVAILDG